MPIYVGNTSYGKLYVGSAGGEINNEDMNVTPSESQQTITADTGYTGLGTVTVGAISSSYVGSGVDRRSSSDLTVSGATVTAPAGYYENAATGTVSSGSEGTPTATKGTVSSHSIAITPSVTNAAGYISGGTHSGTAVTVSASELVSGTLSVTSSGTKDVTNYASASIPAGSATAPATISGSSASVSTGTNTLTLSKTVSVTPNVTTAGYISSGTAGNASVSLSASVTTQAAQTIHPSTSNQTIANGRYLTGTQTINAVTTTNLTADNIKSGVIVKIGDSSDDDCVTSVTGTYTGGGGLTYESGTYTPASNVAQPTISFSGSHSKLPIFVMMSDATNTDPATTNTNHAFFISFWELYTGQPVPAAGASNARYGVVGYTYRANSTTSVSSAVTVLNYSSSNTGSSSAGYPRYWVSETGFKPGSNSTSRYWRSGRTYKWIAVWAPS